MKPRKEQTSTPLDGSPQLAPAEIAALAIVRSIEPMSREDKERVRANFNHDAGYFGQPLDNEAPIVVCDCLSFLRHKGLYEDKPFSVNGNKDVVQLLKQEYDEHFSTKNLKLTGSYSVLNTFKPTPKINAVASLLKLFLTSLPEPLIPRNISKAMLQIVSLKLPISDEATYLGKLVKRIPSPNRECLGLIVSFLREVCAFRKFNNSNADTLGSHFVFSFFGKDYANYSHLKVIIANFIKGAIRIFMPSLNNVKRNTRFVGFGEPVNRKIKNEKFIWLPPKGNDYASVNERDRASGNKSYVLSQPVLSRQEITESIETRNAYGTYSNCESIMPLQNANPNGNNIRVVSLTDNGNTLCYWLCHCFGY